MILFQRELVQEKWNSWKDSLKDEEEDEKAKEKEKTSKEPPKTRE